MSIWFGANVADDNELRLCGDVNRKRVIELGIAPNPNAVAFALAGAKAIVVDPSAERIAAMRADAERNETRVECHLGDLADLGFVTSASVDLVLAAQTMSPTDDLPRLLRQVHRVLKPGASFVVSMTHPVAAMFDPGDPNVRRPYGQRGGIAELYMAFERSNFRLDVIHELPDRRQRDPLVPSVLLLRARKQGV